MSDDNAVVVQAWNTVLYDKFCRFKHPLIDGLSAHCDEALSRRGYPEGARVLDVGCGFGDSTRLIAKRGGLRKSLSRYARNDGVWTPSSTWIVTARNP